MNKQIKLSIKNKQLADGLNLNKLKKKLSQKQGIENEADEPEALKQEDVKKAPVTHEAPSKKAKVVEEIQLPIEPPTRDEESTEEAKTVEKVVEKPAVQEQIFSSPPPRREFQHELREADRPIKIKRFAKEPEVIKPIQATAPESTSKNETISPAKKESEKDLSRKATPKAGKEFTDYKDLPPLKKVKSSQPVFDNRIRNGLITTDEGSWQRRRKRPKIKKTFEEEMVSRPSTLKVRLPISIKNLSAAMKVKSADLLAVLFKQGVTLTLNDYLDDETTVQLIGHELGCAIEIDTAEQDRIQITDKTLNEEIKATDPQLLKIRPPVVTFMGHVDHGKTSLIDAIRKSNRVAYEAGAITQHIGAFQCTTSHGFITVLDTPGHEAFSAMRSRGANVTDIVVLVVAGDEGIKDQTLEALEQAKAASVTIIVALNKCDKENFDPEPIYRGLADKGLVPEQWGGSTIMINCSAKSGEGISELLELIALQSEVMELKANSKSRARGTVLESEIHKGMGNVATLLVQNGTLSIGDSVVFDKHYAKIKTMINDIGQRVQHAGPSTPVEITGLSGLPEAGSEFIVVANEKEAKDISEMRVLETKSENLSLRRMTKLQDSFMVNNQTADKKNLNLILRADVQGSLEALVHSLKKISSQKVEINIISEGVGEVTESDIQLAKTSKASIIGFHTRVESHAEVLMKRVNVTLKLPKIIYEAVDQVKELMIGTLDKIAQEADKGKLEVRAIFKASKIGKIAGCSVLSGNIMRNHKARLIRNGKEIWKGTISSLKREKDDVKEVKKGMDCGIVLDNAPDVEVGDIIECFEVTYHQPTL